MRRPARLSLLLHGVAITALLVLAHPRRPRPAEEPARIEVVFGTSATATRPAVPTPSVAVTPGEGETRTLVSPAPQQPATADSGLLVDHPDDSFVPVRDDPGNAAPDYPPGAWLRREQGTVLLRIHVAPDGSVAQVEKLSSSGHAALDDAAEQAIQRWHFLPAHRDGEAVASYRDQPMTFVIK